MNQRKVVQAIAEEGENFN